MSINNKYWTVIYIILIMVEQISWIKILEIQIQLYKEISAVNTYL